MNKTPRTDAQLKLEAFFDGIGIVETIEAELADKDRQLAEARAEIEQLKQLWSCNLDIIGGELNKQLVEARADAEHWKSECNALQRMAHEARAEVERKDKLIKQMGRAMEKVIANYRVNLRDLTDFENKQAATLEAALEAAERGE